MDLQEEGFGSGFDFAGQVMSVMLTYHDVAVP